MRTALRINFVPPFAGASPEWQFRLSGNVDFPVLSGGTYPYTRNAESIDLPTIYIDNLSASVPLIVPAYTAGPVGRIGPGSGANPVFVPSDFPGVTIDPLDSVVFFQAYNGVTQNDTYDGLQVIDFSMNGPPQFALELTLNYNYTWFV